MEMKDERYIDNTHEYVIKEYKTKEITDPTNPIQVKECYADQTDRRRKIMKDVNNIYNYIPKLCEAHKNSIAVADDNCQFAHNENEVKYHSLVYKTLFCKKRCDDPLCEKARNLDTDFRRIYDYRKIEVVELTIKLEDSDLFKNSLVKYMSLIPVPDSFSLDTYKVAPCKLTGFCSQDPHLCLNYHDLKERRRLPKLFRLSNDICEFAKPDKNSDFFPQLCRLVSLSNFYFT